jgi:glycosyltransferase involved in cell wall biosynthesis
MKEALKQQAPNFDLLHLHSLFLWPSWAAARVAQKTKVPYIVSPRGMLVRDMIKRKNRLIKTLWIKFIERHTLELAAGIHMTSELEAEESRCLGINIASVFVVPNGIDVDEETKSSDRAFSPAIEALIKRSPFILFIGRINWKKGLDRLIASLPYVPGANLGIAGNDEENYERHLQKLADMHGVGNRVIFVGPVYGMEKRALLQRAAVFVLPSYSENFGIAVLEAMAQRCPVIVTPEVGIAGSVKEAGAGIIVEGDPESLGHSLRDILADEAMRLRMGENGRRAAIEKFSWDRIAEQMESAYKRAMTAESR